MKKKPLGSYIRKEFPIFQKNQKSINGQLKPLVYLDSAATAQKPQRVINSMVEHMEKYYGSVHRGAYNLSVKSSEAYENVRSKVAKLIGSSISPEQIVFTKGTTQSLNTLAYGIGEEYLNEKSRIVIPAAEHHANLIPWQQTALRKNCELAYLSFEGKSTASLKLNLSEAKKLINKNTKVVSLAYVGNVLGQINPIQSIIEISKSVGALVVVDCAQSMSCFEDDLFALGADAIAFSPHKMYGPAGVGVLAMTDELMNRLPPFEFGGGMISEVSLEGSDWATGPAKFEAGSPPITDAIGLGTACDWILEVGRKEVHDHSCALATAFLNKLKEIKDIEIFSPNTGQETIVSFKHKKIHPHDLATILDAHNVAMRAGHHCAWPLIRFLGVDALIRASFAVYSDMDDVDIAIEAIKNSLKM